jgi:phage-related holin
MQSVRGKKSSFKRILKYLFGGLSLVFIAILVFMVVHDIITGESSNTAEYCSKYGFLASPGCW